MRVQYAHHIFIQRAASTASAERCRDADGDKGKGKGKGIGIGIGIGIETVAYQGETNADIIIQNTKTHDNKDVSSPPDRPARA